MRSRPLYQSSHQAGSKPLFLVAVVVIVVIISVSTVIVVPVIVPIVLWTVIFFLLVRANDTTGNTAHSTANESTFKSIPPTTGECADRSTCGSTSAGATLSLSAANKEDANKIPRMRFFFIS